MAVKLTVEGLFNYREVHLFKTQSLGIGSYGAVYKAQCDELPCAAKVLHPILFQYNDPGSRHILQRFEQECEFLSAIRHPCIVQYLGTCRDPESGLPVLMMELMDESLTKFLEKSQDPLPYHTQVNICYDIALALAYLHSNGIVHRDLSSNNVLLIAGSRAKVTDFGMSKLLDGTAGITPIALTQCPGTQVYMPPEAFREPPVYTEKIDCFTLGVLGIQIMCRQFPNPGPARQAIEDPRYPLGRVETAIPETERRQSHIDLIDPAHPLLPLALNCLNFNEEDRPTAQVLCRQLADLKEAPQYDQHPPQPRQWRSSSTKPFLPRQGSESDTQHIRILQWKLESTDQLLHTKDQQLQASLREIEKLRGELKQFKEEEVAAAKGDLKQLKWEEQAAKEEKMRALAEKEAGPKLLTSRLHNQESLPPRKEDAKVEESVSTVNGDTQKKPSKDVNGRKVSSYENREHLEAAAVDGIRLKWRTCTKTPEHMVRGASAVDGSVAYFRSSSNSVYSYDWEDETWSSLPDYPYSDFSLAIVKGLLTGIGGCDKSKKATNRLFSLTGEDENREWIEVFPPMPTKRWFAAVATTGKSLIVVGGEKGSNRLSVVEVMDVDTLKWSEATPLPHPFSNATAAICGDTVYLLGGLDKRGQTQMVLQHSIKALLSSNRKVLSLSRQKIWRRAADVPVCQPTCTALCDRLLAVGGIDSHGQDTSAIHVYNAKSDTWELIGEVPVPLSSLASQPTGPPSSCLVAVLPRNNLVVVHHEGVYVATSASRSTSV